MRLRLFKPEFPSNDISVSKQFYPDNEKIEDTDIFDSNIPTHNEVDQNENDNLDQDLPPRNEGKIRIPLRDEQHEREQQQTQTRTEDEDRMSSRPSRNNQSRYGLRENPTPKTYPDFLIHENTTVRNALRKTKNVNLTI